MLGSAQDKAALARSLVERRGLPGKPGDHCKPAPSSHQQLGHSRTAPTTPGRKTPTAPATPKSSSRFKRSAGTTTKPANTEPEPPACSVAEFIASKSLIKNRIIKFNASAMSANGKPSFELRKGRITIQNRTLDYVVSDVMGMFFSVNFTMVATHQPWTVVVPSNEMITELLRVWGQKLQAANLRKLCGWMVDAIKVEFSAEAIISAELQHFQFRELMVDALFAAAHSAARLIQNMVREYLARRQETLRVAGEEKIRRGLQVAKERVRQHELQQKAAAALAEEARQAEKTVRLRLGADKSGRRRQFRVAAPSAHRTASTGAGQGGDGHVDSGAFSQNPNMLAELSVASSNSGVQQANLNKQAAAASAVVNSAVNSILYGNLNAEEIAKTQHLEDELQVLRTEMESQRLQMFYGRGMAKVSGPEGDEPGDEEAAAAASAAAAARGRGTRASSMASMAGANSSAAPSTPTAASSGAINAKSQKEVRALKSEVETLRRALADVQTELLEQRRRSADAERRSLVELVQSRNNAEVAAAKAAEIVRLQALEEMKTQLAQREAQTSKMILRQRQLDQQREQELKKEIEDKYQALEEKLAADVKAAAEQQDALKTQVQELRDTSKPKPFVSPRTSFAMPPKRARSGRGVASHRLLPQDSIPRMEVQTMTTTQRGRPFIINGLPPAEHTLNKRPARSTKPTETHSLKAWNASDDEEEESEEEEDTESMKARQAAKEAQRQALFLAQQQQLQEQQPPRPRTWMEWLMGLKQPEPAPPVLLVAEAPLGQIKVNSTFESHRPSMLLPGEEGDEAFPMGAGERTVRRVRKRKKKDAARLERRNLCARRIQHFVRFRLVRRKIALNPDPAWAQLRKLALMFLLPNTSEKELIDSALRTAGELCNAHLLLKALERVTKLLEVYDYAEVELPLDAALLCQSVAQFGQDRVLASLGMKLVFSLMALRPLLFFEPAVVPAYAHMLALLLDSQCHDEEIFALVTASNTEEPPECMSLLILMAIFRLIKRSKECRAALATPAMCLHLRRGLERYHESSPEMMVFYLRFIVVLAAECPEAQLRLGESLVGECVLMSFLRSYADEALGSLHVRALRNLCASGCLFNQLMLGRGMFPHLLVNAAILLKQSPPALVELLQLLTAIFVNCEENQLHFQAAGCLEAMTDLLTLHASHVGVTTACLRGLARLAITSPASLATLPPARRLLQGTVVQTLQAHDADGRKPAIREEARLALLTLQAATRQIPTPPLPAVWLPRNRGLPAEYDMLLSPSMDENEDDDVQGVELDDDDDEEVASIMGSEYGAYRSIREGLEAVQSQDEDQDENQNQNQDQDLQPSGEAVGEASAAEGDEDEERDRVDDLTPIGTMADHALVPDGHSPALLGDVRGAILRAASFRTKDLLPTFNFFNT